MGDLGRQPGIEQVTVDVATRRVRIAYYADQTSSARLQAMLADIGYPAAPDQPPGLASGTWTATLTRPGGRAGGAAWA